MQINLVTLKDQSFISLLVSQYQPTTCNVPPASVQTLVEFAPRLRTSLDLIAT